MSPKKGVKRVRRQPPTYRTWFSSVRLRNFRCYADTGDIPLRPLTIIVGPNNAGKSTILNSILLLTWVFAPTLTTEL